jgi:hypothetical protein
MPGVLTWWALACRPPEAAPPLQSLAAGPDLTPSPAPAPTAPPEPLWIALAGGGYHAHTHHAAWTFAWLEASGEDLGALFANVDGFAANSGGGWYLTQLAWSEEFRAAVEGGSPGWTTEGYLGQTADLLQLGDPCDGWTGAAAVLCTDLEALGPVFSLLSLPSVRAMDWDPFVEQVVYGPYGMTEGMAGLTLGSPREAWAADKDLLFVVSVLTDEVALAEEPSFPWARDWYTATSEDERIPSLVGIVPAMLSSTAGVAAPVVAPGPLLVEYSSDDLLAPSFAAATLPADIEHAELEVLAVASASSAVQGAVASARTVRDLGLDDLVPLTDADIASAVRELAPAFRVGERGLEPASPAPGVEDHAEGHSVRLADGGYHDNTAVTGILRHLAAQGAVDGFRILALLPTTVAPSAHGQMVVTDDVAWLFGVGASAPVNGVAPLCLLGLCVDTPVPHVFEERGLDAAVERWSWSDRGIDLALYEVPVVTVENPMWGIPAGAEGTVWFLTETAPEAELLPLDPDDLELYGTLLDVVREGALEGGGWAATSELFGG